MLILARARCLCDCHTAPDDSTFGRIEAPSVPCTDPIAAITACATCRHHHTLAFSGRPPELDAPLSGRRWNPPSLEAIPQADGGTDAT